MKNGGSILVLCALLLRCACAQAPPAKSRPSSIETVAGGDPSGIAGPEFAVPYISGLSEDRDGNIYFLIQARNRVYRLGADDGKVTIFAGNGVHGDSIEGARAANSPLSDPWAVAVDPAGDVYIRCPDRLVRVNGRSGTIVTVFTLPHQVGSPESTVNPEQMAFGANGDLYFTELDRIKSYSFASGEETVLAGNGTHGLAQPGLSAIDSPLEYPREIAVAPDGNVYFIAQEPRVFHINPVSRKLEAIDLILKDEHSSPAGYDEPHSIALDESGHLFVAQGNRSRVLSIDLKTNAVSVVAGTGAQGFNGDNIPATRANVTGPTHVVSDAVGNLVVDGDARLRSINHASGLILTVAGNGQAAALDDSIAPLDAKLLEPTNAIPAPDGSLYITSTFSARLLRLTPKGELITVAGGGDFMKIGTEPGSASQVNLYLPQGIFISKNGEIYFSDDDNRIIRHLDLSDGTVTNLATTPKQFHSTGGFPAALVGNEEYFYLSDPSGDCIWRISRSTSEVELYLGRAPRQNGPSDSSGADSLRTPSGLTLDADGNVYFADGGERNGRIVRIDRSSRKPTVILSELNYPSGLAFRSPKVLCFAESGAHQVRCVDLETRSQIVAAGNGRPGFSGDGEPAECAQLNRPSGISFDERGDLYIADTGNQRIRRVQIGQTPARCKP